MWPAATWIVVGLEIRRSHVEVALGFGFVALPRQRMRRPAGAKAASEPYFRAEIEERLVPVAEPTLLALGAQASSTGAGQEHRL